jgi:hypothetical protein
MKGAECTSQQWLSAMHAIVGTKKEVEFIKFTFFLTSQQWLKVRNARYSRHKNKA